MESSGGVQPDSKRPRLLTTSNRGKDHPPERGNVPGSGASACRRSAPLRHPGRVQPRVRPRLGDQLRVRPALFFLPLAVWDVVTTPGTLPDLAADDPRCLLTVVSGAIAFSTEEVS